MNSIGRTMIPEAPEMSYKWRSDSRVGHGLQSPRKKGGHGLVGRYLSREA